MIRLLGILILASIIWTPVVAGPQAKQASQSLADELKELQGVWQSPPADEKQITVVFMGDKVGYAYSNPKGDTLRSVQSLEIAKQDEANGKRFFDIGDPKFPLRRVDYRLEKGLLTVVINKTEFRANRVNTRVSADPAAKELVAIWKIAAGEVAGQRASAAETGLDEIIITEDRYIWKTPEGKELMNVYYRIDAKAKPATIDIFAMKPGTILRGIYEVKDNELRLAQQITAEEDKNPPRPATFATKGTKDILMLEAKKAK